MARKTEERREALRQTLITLATTKIAADGLAALRARDLAADAGCSVGAIYTVFEDLTALCLAVNATTFAALGERVSAHRATAAPKTPAEELTALSLGYLAFAQEHTHLWRALFEIELGPASPAPTWYRSEMENLFSVILPPVRALLPDLTSEQSILMARALFSSVHGIVTLGLEDASAGVPRDQIGAMIEMLFHHLT